MEATDYLTRQHREIEEALRTALATDDPAVKRSQFLDIADALIMHIAAEEQVFYPAVHRQPNEDVLLESLEEHLALKRLLSDLLALQAGRRHVPAQAARAARTGRASSPRRGAQALSRSAREAGRRAARGAGPGDGRAAGAHAGGRQAAQGRARRRPTRPSRCAERQSPAFSRRAGRAATSRRPGRTGSAASANASARVGAARASGACRGSRAASRRSAPRRTRPSTCAYWSA